MNAKTHIFEITLSNGEVAHLGLAEIREEMKSVDTTFDVLDVTIKAAQSLPPLPPRPALPEQVPPEPTGTARGA